MNQNHRHFSAELDTVLAESGIDPELTSMVMDRINALGQTEARDCDVTLPGEDDPRILDMRLLTTWTADARTVRRAIDRFGIPVYLVRGADTGEDRYIFDRRSLRRIGIYLLPFLSYGILNGGSATSYTDSKKNHQFNAELFALYASFFERFSRGIGGRSKGLTPAFFDDRYGAGPSFVELKMRSLLNAALRRQRLFGRDERTLYPMFQMTNAKNDAEIEEAFAEYRESPFIAPLCEETGIDITDVSTGIQPLIAAFSHSDAGSTRSVFLSAYGRHAPLALPGGHGQCFAALRGVFSKLLAAGKAFVQLGNVDNLGNTVDETSLAILALSGAPAGFDFSVRTPVDIKGGILVRGNDGRLTCVDIGPAIGFDEIVDAETAGKSVLFNCATGVFNLEMLVESLDRIIAELPIRLSDQDKDVGRYAQAEQITWEVIGLLDNPLIFAARKYDRFLAAKLLVENLLTSGIHLDANVFVESDDRLRALRILGRNLNEGLVRRLAGVYGLRYGSAGWAA